MLAFWEKRWPHKFILNLTDLYHDCLNGPNSKIHVPKFDQQQMCIKLGLYGFHIHLIQNSNFCCHTHIKDSNRNSRRNSRNSGKLTFHALVLKALEVFLNLITSWFHKWFAFKVLLVLSNVEIAQVLKNVNEMYRVELNSPQWLGCLLNIICVHNQAPFKEFYRSFGNVCLRLVLWSLCTKLKAPR